MYTVYKVGERDHDIVEEFNRQPIGRHSPALQRVLNVFRGEPTTDKYVLVCTKPHKEWVLGQLPDGRGKPVKMLKGQVFTSVEEAEREIFRRRWKKYTGKDL
ncbi:MAG TPA: hypothetical protein VNN62_10360 [Methylomirabilota bacterium]|nr:hypothetical protein [Methylomirabilota bacterium]